MHECAVERARNFCECCKVIRCRDSGCYISMPVGRVSARVVYSGSLYQANHQHPSALCDCMAFWCSGEDHVYALELKSGALTYLRWPSSSRAVLM
jgi:hypothetical protein